MAEEPTTTRTKGMISLKSLILGLVIAFPLMASVLIYQKSSNAEFPLGLVLVTSSMMVANMYLAKKPVFRQYFVRRVKQLTVQLPAFPVQLQRFRVTTVTPTQDMEMTKSAVVIP